MSEGFGKEGQLRCAAALVAATLYEIAVWLERVPPGKEEAVGGARQRGDPAIDVLKLLDQPGPENAIISREPEPLSMNAARSWR